MFRQMRRNIAAKDRISPLSPRPMSVSSPPAEMFGPTLSERIEMLRKKLASEDIRRQVMMNSVTPFMGNQGPMPVTWGGMGHGSAMQQPLFQNQAGTSLSRTDTLLPAPYRRT